MKKKMSLQASMKIEPRYTAEELKVIDHIVESEKQGAVFIQRQVVGEAFHEGGLPHLGAPDEKHIEGEKAGADRNGRDSGGGGSHSVLW